MTAHRRLIPAAIACTALAVALVAHASAPASAQSTSLQQQARTDQVRDQLRSSSLREQQRQQTSDTTRKAFQQSGTAQQGIHSADSARRDRHRSQQRDRVQDYLHREQAASTSHSGSTSAASQPAHASSSR